MDSDFTHAKGRHSVADLAPKLLEWKRVYNTVRPHQALGYLTPEQWLTKLRNGKRDSPPEADSVPSPDMSSLSISQTKGGRVSLMSWTTHGVWVLTAWL